MSSAKLDVRIIEAGVPTKTTQLHEEGTPALTIRLGWEKKKPNYLAVGS